MFKWVRAGHIISLGLFIYLLAYVGSETIIDEEVTVPANDYLHYAVRVYPGQGIQAYAGVRTLNGTEHEYGVLELMMMDDAGYNHFLYPEEYTESGDRTHEWVARAHNQYPSPASNLFYDRDTVWLSTPLQVIDRLNDQQ